MLIFIVTLFIIISNLFFIFCLYLSKDRNERSELKVQITIIVFLSIIVLFMLGRLVIILKLL